MSPKGVRDVLETLARVFTFGRKKGLLPAELGNPVTREVIGSDPKIDPIRPIPYPLEDRIAMVRRADEYQLSHIVPRFVLPSRPGELAGLLIHEVDTENCFLRFGTRFEERDWTKGRTCFSVPFPPELHPLIATAIGVRIDGPVFRSRRFFDGTRRPKTPVANRGDMTAAIERALAEERSSLIGPGDTKPIIRRTIHAAGGVTTDTLHQEFVKLREKADLDNDATFYELRSSVLTDMDSSGVSEALQKYVSGHSPYGKPRAHYLTLKPDRIIKEMGCYWAYIRELLDAIRERAQQLGLVFQEGDQSDA